MILSFILTMPSNNAWNGKWTDDNKLYARTRSIRDKDKAARIAEKGYFAYNFGDGWRAAISVEIVKASRAAKLRKASQGFWGYDWMIDSIIDNMEIKTASSRNT